MELLDRYLQAVKPLLPKEQRQDILAELEENITSRMEDRQAELGRPLTEAEQEEILSQIGHPLLVAGRYRTAAGSFTFGRWQLVGPELFPFYLRGVQIVLGVTAVALVAILAGLSFWKPIPFGDAVNAFTFYVVLQFAIQTVIWSAVQANITKHPDRWRPQAVPAAREPHRVSRFESIMQITVLLALSPWVVGVLSPEHVSLGDGIELGAIWHQIYVPVVLVMLVSLVQAVVNLVRPDWSRFRWATRALTTLAWVITLVFVLKAGDWVVLTDLTGDIESKRHRLELVNHYVFFYSILVTAIASAVQVVFDLRKLFKRDDASPKAAALTGARQ